MKAIKSNTVNETGLPSRARRVMVCLECSPDATFSANAGDYFEYPEDHVFTCHTCGGPMELLYKTTKVEFTEEPQ